MNKIFILLAFLAFSKTVFSIDIPQHIQYTRIYAFLDELATDRIIEIRSVVRPFTRQFIADRLMEAKEQEHLLNNRQRRELDFFLNDFALERGKLPDTRVNLVNNESTRFSLVQPAIHYRNDFFNARMTPILGAELFHNRNGTIASRIAGAEIHTRMGRHVSVFGSFTDKVIIGELLSQPNFLNNFPGMEYKESARNGADYSEVRGGVMVGTDWGSIGLVKDKVMWGDNYNGSNILSGRAPSFPMIRLQLRPTRWFQLDYFHGWLVSNVLDSTSFYVNNAGGRHYRPANKFIAANMFTFTPIKGLNLSMGNSIIYAERNVQAAFFIPIAFFKSLDHTMTKGTPAENQNSQLFFNISSRNIRHLHLFTSIFIDEISFARFRRSNPETNPISYKIGFNLSNFPIQNLSLVAEYTRTSIINYKHAIPTLTWTSNSYNLGHWLGDNAQEVFVELRYRPIRGLDLSLSYLNAKRGNEYNFIRGRWAGGSKISNIISQDFQRDVVWTNTTIAFRANYEIFNNAFAGLTIKHSNIRGHNPTSEQLVCPECEVRLDAQGYLDLFTPRFFHGRNTTISMNLNIGF